MKRSFIQVRVGCKRAMLCLLLLGITSLYAIHSHPWDGAKPLATAHQCPLCVAAHIAAAVQPGRVVMARSAVDTAILPLPEVELHEALSSFPLYVRPPPMF